jgi:hypothetical protein
MHCSRGLWGELIGSSRLRLFSKVVPPLCMTYMYMYSRLVFHERKIDGHRILEDYSLYSVFRSSGEDGSIFVSLVSGTPSVHRQLSTGWL